VQRYRDDAQGDRYGPPNPVRSKRRPRFEIEDGGNRVRPNCGKASLHPVKPAM